MKFNQWLHEAVIESSYTRASLSKAIGCSKPAVDKWLAGDSIPRVVTLYIICGLLFGSADQDKAFCHSAKLLQCTL
tara:strand:+ start:3479 stop:3706 length:228 start_codon:yes stop_codon:yes gene_type:complete